MSEVVDLLTGRWNGHLPEKAVVITVDDGFRSAYTVLFPLLKRYNAKATLFVYTEWIGKTPAALTWEQLREMAQSGLVEIASHTVTHIYPRRLKRSLSGEQFKRGMEWEFVQSKRELEQKLGVKVEGLAYPGGYVEETLKALARKAGYRWAVVINPKPITVSADLYALPRYGVSSETTVAALKAWVTKQSFQLVQHSHRAKKTGKTTANMRRARGKLSARITAHRSR
jgi:peptidoglycan/xylan/chitin deacetylase (PgdA/CDA1 family)